MGRMFFCTFVSMPVWMIVWFWCANTRYGFPVAEFGWIAIELVDELGIDDRLFYDGQTLAVGLGMWGWLWLLFISRTIRKKIFTWGDRWGWGEFFVRGLPALLISGSLAGLAQLIFASFFMDSDGFRKFVPSAMHVAGVSIGCIIALVAGIATAIMVTKARVSWSLTNAPLGRQGAVLGGVVGLFTSEKGGRVGSTAHGAFVGWIIGGLLELFSVLFSPAVLLVVFVGGMGYLVGMVLGTLFVAVLAVLVPLIPLVIIVLSTLPIVPLTTSVLGRFLFIIPLVAFPVLVLYALLPPLMFLLILTAVALPIALILLAFGYK